MAIKDGIIRTSRLLCKLWFTTLLAATAFAIIVLHAFMIFHVYEHHEMKIPDTLGNRPSVIRNIESEAAGEDDFSFLVIGDINKGVETFENIVDMVRHVHSPSFLILLGDCSSEPSMAGHQYFCHEFSETKMKLPTFITAGNHDIRKGFFSVEEFEELYGPVNFSFVFRDCLFIGLGGVVELGHRHEAADFLDRELSKYKGKVRRTFVFMHYAPPVISDVPTNPEFEGAQRFIDLFDKFNVDYVISGHYHRLARTKVRNTVYLVSGGGGAEFHKDGFKNVGLLHHALHLIIRKESIAEQVLPAQEASFTDRIEGFLEWNLAGLYWPIARQWMWAVILLNLMAAGTLLISFLRYKKAWGSCSNA